jgi:hypothetical protein
MAPVQNQGAWKAYPQLAPAMEFLLECSDPFEEMVRNFNA